MDLDLVCSGLACRKPVLLVPSSINKPAAVENDVQNLGGALLSFRLFPISLIFFMVLATNSAFAVDNAPYIIKTVQPTYMALTLGGEIAMGRSFGVVGSEPEDISLLEPSSIFSGGGRIYFDLYFQEHFAIETGLGVVKKGYAYGQATDQPCSIWGKAELLYLEIPLGFTANFYGARLGVLPAFALAMRGKSSDILTGCPGTAVSGVKEETVWGEQEWENHRKTNLNFKFFAGYRIQSKWISVVPNLSWTIHAIDDLHSPEGRTLRHSNIMVNLAVEYALIPPQM